MRRGVIGELLVVLALLASVFLIIATFSHTKDVPNVPKKSLQALQDVQTILSRAIRSWLHEGVTKEPLACNGLYPTDTSQLTSTLEPYVRNELASATSVDKTLQVTPGVLSDVGFDGLSELRITLANGKIIYNDGTIYSENGLDKEYLFNVRLPLALQVIQDWIRCDAGNLSSNLESQFGRACFFGKKPKDYGNSATACVKSSEQLTPSDRDYMLQKAPTRTEVANAANASVSALNDYFAAKASCKAPLSDDTGIVCSYTIQDLEFQYQMMPWTSDKIINNPELEYPEYMSDDSHVWAVSPQILTTTWSDKDLGCACPGGTGSCICAPGEQSCTCDDGTAGCKDTREFVNPHISVIPFQLSDKYQNVKDGYPSGFIAYPILYVNVSRGTKFTLAVTCKDNRAALLGQPLEYTFKLRYGIKDLCGPSNGTSSFIDCGACAPMPIASDACIKPSKPASCDTYFQVCAKSVVWQYLQSNPGKSGDYMTVVGADTDLQKKINDVCQTVWGFEDKYPPPKPPSDPPPPGWSECNMAYGQVCCGHPGLAQDSCSKLGLTDCSPSLDINGGKPQTDCAATKQTNCFMGVSDVRALCYGPAQGCPQIPCYDAKECSQGTDWSCKYVPTPNRPCGACQTCEYNGDNNIACTYTGPENSACDPGALYRNKCVATYTCQQSQGGCAAATYQPKGTDCNYGSTPPECRSYFCNGVDGNCGVANNPDDTPCGSPKDIQTTVNGVTIVCTYSSKCNNGGCDPDMTAASNCRSLNGCTLVCSSSDPASCHCT